MKKNKWYVAQVAAPGLTAAEVEALVEDLAEGLSRADHRMKGQATKPDDYPEPAAPKKGAAKKAAPAPSYQPLYFCHGKF